MAYNRSYTAASKAAVDRLGETPRIDALHPCAARFVYSLRLIALHERVGRDPVPELAVRLGSVETAARSLQLSQAISATWPENVHVFRFCCSFMSHDEATIGAMVEAGATCSRDQFERAIEGLIRPDRMQRLWEAVLGLVSSELRAA